MSVRCTVEKHKKITTNLQAATGRICASYTLTVGMQRLNGLGLIEATIPVGSSSSQASDIQPAAAEVDATSQRSNGSTATRRNPVQEVQVPGRDRRAWHIIPQKEADGMGRWVGRSTPNRRSGRKRSRGAVVVVA